MNKPYLEIYTDGACKGNPGPGGWAAVLIWNGQHKEIFGSETNTTNNRMELKAAIEGLKAVKKNIDIKLYTDSTYVRSGITEWIHSWQKNGWNKGKVKNIDLWQELHSLNSLYNVQWIWVKGHSGNKYNEIVDKLASDAAESAMRADQF